MPDLNVHAGSLSDFTAARQNANSHTELGMRLLEDSMRNDGYTEPMVAAADGEMLSGSARHETAADVFPNGEAIVVESDGTKPIVVVRTDIPDARTERAQRIAISANRIAQANLKWDAQVLTNLQAAGTVNLKKLWGNDAELEALMRSVRAQKGESEEAAQLITRADELQEIWKVRPGDLFVIPTATGVGAHRLLCGDSTSEADVTRLMDGQRFAVLFTDPPYGIAYDTTSYGRSTRDLGAVANDKLEGEPFVDFLEKFLRAAMAHALDNASLYICMANSTYHHLVAAVQACEIRYAVPIIWYKNHFALNWDRYKPQHELILHGGNGAVAEDEFVGYRADSQFVFYGGVGSNPTSSAKSRWFGPRNESTVWQIARDPVSSYEHPTQKPVELPRRAVRNSTAVDEIVLDLFAGSGSTLAAADIEGRLGYGMEMTPKFCAVTLERLKLLGLAPVRADTL